MASLLESFKTFGTGVIPGIYVTDPLHQGINANKDPAFDGPKTKDILGLLEKGTFKFVHKYDVEDDAIILGGIFVLAIKNVDTNNPTYKARFVVQGHAVLEKDYLVHSANTIRQHYVRTLVSISAISVFRVWPQDVSQAYLQAGDKLNSNVYINTPMELQMGTYKLLKLVKPLYGLTNAGSYWHRTLLRNLPNYLNKFDSRGPVFFHKTG